MAARNRKRCGMGEVGKSLWVMLAMILSASGCTIPDNPGKLNVLLITMDTTRADYLGSYGSKTARTPNLDRLADEGTLFTRCATSSPQTLPSHSSILTAVYPYVHGARRNWTTRLTGANLTLAETLREAGYETRATVASFVLDRRFGTAQGFDVYHDVSVERMHSERRGDEVRDDALDMLRSLAGEPFFLWVHFFDPHYPYDSPHDSPRRKENDPTIAYADEIAFMDTQIGHLLGEVDRLGLKRNTVVVVVADHGEGLGQHGETSHIFFLYETTQHTPLIFRAPGTIPAGRKISAQVRTIDITPTILALLGLPAWNHAQGVSLVPLLRGERQDLGLAAYGETLEPNALFGLSPLRSLSAGEWKYILAPKPELYNLSADPGEMRNLITGEPGKAAEMRAQLRALIARAPAPFDAGDVSMELDAADVARLRSLGYTASGKPAASRGESELDRFEPEGGNPKDYHRYFRKRSELMGAILEEDLARANRLARELIEALPEVPHLHVDMANVFLAQGRVDEAIEAIDRAVSLAPDNGRPLAESMPNLPLIQLNTARALREAGRLDEAAAAFQRAMAIGPGSFKAHREYGNFLLFGTRQYPEAVEQLEIAIQETPNDVDLLHDLGWAYTALKHFEKADRILGQALKIEPKNHRIVQAVGILRMQQNRLPEAADQFRRALQLKPGSPEARAALKHVLEKIKRSPEAIKR